MKSIGENIRNIREAKKISQYAVAFTIGISQAAYSKIERGETEIKARHVYMIAEVLKTSVYEILPASISSSSLEGEDYLLKPIIIAVKKIWFSFLARKRMEKYNIKNTTPDQS